ncbi:MAG TPA: putative sugar nucleotidyl transferase [Gemmatimonadales bacterium]|nr:putative sugar nucleotidyl transferase [Gemmatimonadales bacterium]
MPIPLILLEPEPSPAWAPFAGVRPVAELRAGVWRIRERWEAALDLDAALILGAHVAGFRELDEPPCREPEPVAGPAVVVRSDFVPLGTGPVEPVPRLLESGLRRLTAGELTVGWLVPAGARWSGPGDDGPAIPVDGMALRGAFQLLDALELLLAKDCARFVGSGDGVPAGSIVLGDPGAVVVRGALVEPGVVFDVRHGAVVLEEGCEVRSGTRLEGPLFAGAGSRLLGHHLRASVFGPRSSVRGEVSHAIFLGYANKSHDGFVGHSVIGHWVNLGAGTTTSNLKNTYGPVRLEVAGARIETGRMFLGSLIGDHAKTAIGTMLPTGSVIGAGANVFGGSPPKYVPPFAWGSDGRERMSEDGFLQIAERVMPRRDVAVTPERRASLRATYRRLVR